MPNLVECIFSFKIKSFVYSKEKDTICSFTCYFIYEIQVKIRRNNYSIDLKDEYILMRIKKRKIISQQVLTSIFMV